MKYCKIVKKELIIDKIDKTLNVNDLLLELYEKSNNNDVYFKKDVWLTLISEIIEHCNYTLVNNFAYYRYVEQLKTFLEDSPLVLYDEKINYKGFLITVPCVTFKTSIENHIFYRPLKYLFCQSPYYYFSYWKLFYNQKKGKVNFLNVVKQYAHIMLCAVNNPTYFDDYKNLPNGWSDKLTFLNKLLSKGKDVFDYGDLFYKYFCDKNFNQQLEVSSQIRLYCKKWGDKVIDLLIESDVIDLSNEKKVKQLVYNNLLKRNQFLSVPLENLPKLSNGWLCVQLLRPSDLFEETEVQGNCIGGSHIDHYKKRLLSGNLLAFSLRKMSKGQEVERITLTFAKSGNKWEVSEYQGSVKAKRIAYKNEMEKTILDYNLETLRHYLNRSAKLKDDILYDY